MRGPGISCAVRARGFLDQFYMLLFATPSFHNFRTTCTSLRDLFVPSSVTVYFSWIAFQAFSNHFVNNIHFTVVSKYLLLLLLTLPLPVPLPLLLPPRLLASCCGNFMEISSVVWIFYIYRYKVFGQSNKEHFLRHWWHTSLLSSLSALYDPAEMSLSPSLPLSFSLSSTHRRNDAHFSTNSFNCCFHWLHCFQLPACFQRFVCISYSTNLVAIFYRVQIRYGSAKVTLHRLYIHVYCTLNMLTYIEHTSTIFSLCSYFCLFHKFNFTFVVVWFALRVPRVKRKSFRMRIAQQKISVFVGSIRNRYTKRETT